MIHVKETLEGADVSELFEDPEEEQGAPVLCTCGAALPPMARSCRDCSRRAMPDYKRAWKAGRVDRPLHFGRS